MSQGGVVIGEVQFTETFESDFRKLPREIKDEVKERLKLLLRDPRPGKLRFEKLKGHRNPSVYTIHVTANHSHKLSMEIRGNVAVLRRVGTHAKIDRQP